MPHGWQWASTRSEWPIPEDIFVPRLQELLRERHELQDLVGFSGTNSSRVAWIKATAHSKYDVGAGQLIGRPDVVAAYTDSWLAWFSQLPALVRANQTRISPSALPLPPAVDSALTQGWASCRSWECARLSHAIHHPIDYTRYRHVIRVAASLSWPPVALRLSF